MCDASFEPDEILYKRATGDLEDRSRALGETGTRLAGVSKDLEASAAALDAARRVYAADLSAVRVRFAVWNRRAALMHGVLAMANATVLAVSLYRMRH